MGSKLVREPELPSEPLLVVDQVVKRFGSTLAVDRVSLNVRRGEIVSLLGPSGCGKTSTLRLIAGFIRPDAGQIRLAGTVLNDVPTHARNLGIVFQNFALFPHMTVEANVAFGLRTRRVPRGQVEQRVAEALELVQLGDMNRRYPSELSGGQQQRVAIARAIVIRPDLLLLDEPLSSLDAILRSKMQLEIRRIIEQAGVTAIFVTHDQEEALSISDRIIVMSGGRVEQVGTPHEVYSRPTSEFVATFLGRSNIVRGIVQDRKQEAIELRADGGTIIRISGVSAEQGELVRLQIRPEAFTIVEEPCGDVDVIPGVVVQSAFLGSVYEYVVHTGFGEFLAHVPARSWTKRYPRGGTVYLRWNPEDVGRLSDAADRGVVDRSPTEST